jgi:alkylation response protein AidB-like acyl-CoA dehydrogenase
MAPTIQELGREIERAGRLPDELIEQFIEAGFFNMLVERELGGGETDPVTATKVIETISSADSSAGWVAMIGSVTPFWATALMPKEGAREIFGAGQDVVMVGTLVPYGRAVKTSGGYRISGSWPFGSGCQHANWLASACWLFDGEAPIQRDDGRPAWAEFLTPIQDCGILDTWHVTGMQGTGSHDYTIDDVFVPERRMFYHVSQTLPVRTEPRYSYLAATVALMAAVPLGIARAATDELRALLPSKAGAPEFKPMSEDFEKQVDVARADTLVGSASAYLYDTLEQVWGRVAKGEPLSKELRGRFRAACTNAVLSSVEAVDLVYATAGTTAIYTKSSLERRFRDVHTAAAHALVRSATRADAGRLLMELEPLVKIF